MTDSTRSIYSLTIGGVDCRCAGELISMKVLQVEGVEAASLGSDDVLTVFADPVLASVDDVVRAVVDAGFVPADTIEVGDVTARGVNVVRVVEVTSEVPESEAPVEITAQEHDEEPVDGPSAEPADEPMPAFVSEVAEEETVFVTDGWREPVAVPLADPSAAEREIHYEAVTAVATTESPLEGVAETIPVAAYARAELVQRLDVAVSDSYYPARLVVQADVPVEIGFGEGHGCLAHVLFEDFGIDADLTDGGAIVRLPGLAEGMYTFSCGMKMVFGTVEAVA